MKKNKTSSRKSAQARKNGSHADMASIVLLESPAMIVDRLLLERISIRLNGEKMMKTKAEVIALGLFGKALKGDVKAVIALLEFACTAPPEPKQTLTVEFVDSDCTRAWADADHG